MTNVLVTGVSGSVGHAVALEFARLDRVKTIWGTFRSANDLTSELECIKQVRLVACDFVTADLSELPVSEVDVLVNSVGANSGKGLVGEVTLKEFDALMHLNPRVPFHLVQLVLPGMLDRGFGRIVNVNSVWGLRGSSNNLAYTMSKHAMSGLTKSVAKDYGGSGVTCNDVSPGAIESRMMDRIATEVAARQGSTTEAVLKDWRASQNASRFVTPEEVAAAVVFASSDAAGGMNGSTIVVDGGMVC